MRAIRYALICFTISMLRKLGSVLEPLYNRLIKTKGLHYDFQIRDDDIFIASYPKSGTTWLQMVMYQLLSDGNMDFFHIRNEVPFLEQHIANEREFLTTPLTPRVYATHLGYHEIPKGKGKYIYIMREGMDVFLSMYYHAKTSDSFPGDFNAYFENFRQARYKGWARHIDAWVTNGDRLNILFLRYEDLKTDLAGTIRKLIDFCGLNPSGIDMERIMHRCSFTFMKEHEHKFDMNTYLSYLYGFGNTTSFIRKGETGGSKQYFSPEQTELFLSHEYDQYPHNPYLQQYKERIRAAAPETSTEKQDGRVDAETSMIRVSMK